ncbi:hypothetical protein DPMN_101984 [Dreissena polymorpha]|uniref:Uncharacterized protein n=1 Tax=Dreissena polymorpha TaxID=45954 RepID=A0A9D4LIF8_DREPO|nr:hypothetical protein DPMN_101984 [Dreissena polymorpha]
MLAPDEEAPGALGAFGFSAAGTTASPQTARARAYVAMLDVGPIFHAPPPEPRTQVVQASMARMKAFRRKKRAVLQQNMAPFPIIVDNANQRNKM